MWTLPRTSTIEVSLRYRMRSQHNAPYGRTHVYRVLLQANYTDWTIVAAGEVVPTFAGRGCCVVREANTFAHSSQFSRSKPPLFLSSSSPIILIRLSKSRSSSNTSQKIW
jgi:hypothetical protein